MSAAEFKRQFIERTRLARERAGFTQQEIADLLEIPQDTYKNYETKRFLPHHLLPKFCLACRISGGELYGTAPGKREKRRQVA